MLNFVKLFLPLWFSKPENLLSLILDTITVPSLLFWASGTGPAVGVSLFGSMGFASGKSPEQGCGRGNCDPSVAWREFWLGSEDLTHVCVLRYASEPLIITTRCTLALFRNGRNLIAVVIRDTIKTWVLVKGHRNSLSDLTSEVLEFLTTLGAPGTRLVAAQVGSLDNEEALHSFSSLTFIDFLLFPAAFIKMFG